MAKYDKVYKTIVVDNLQSRNNFYKELIQETEIVIEDYKKELKDLDEKCINADSSERIRYQIDKDILNQRIFFYKGLINAYEYACKDFERLANSFDGLKGV